jgi:hypothetical protein
VKSKQKGLTLERLKELLSYNRRTGAWRWRVKRNGIRDDGIAGTVRDGYVYIMIDGKFHCAHVLAWFYVTGEWPPNQVDHRNTNRSDNRWRNLRAATPSQNRANGRVNRDNKSGIKGVSKITLKDGSFSYRAQIVARGKWRGLGCFKTPDEAAAAYLAAAKLHFGEFARGSQL